MPEREMTYEELLREYLIQRNELNTIKNELDNIKKEYNKLISYVVDYWSDKSKIERIPVNNSESIRSTITQPLERERK